MSSSTNIGAYSASMSQSLYDHGKAVGRMIEASQNTIDVTKQKITDNALQEVQKATSSKDELLSIGSKLSIYA